MEPTSSRYQSFKEFWPFYLSQHLDPVCRGLHYGGTLFGLGLAIFFISSGLYFFIPLSFLPGYAFAWTGHFGFEKNRPATFKYPWWSFLGDWVMLFYFLTGKIQAEAAKPEVQALVQK